MISPPFSGPYVGGVENHARDVGQATLVDTAEDGPVQSAPDAARWQDPAKDAKNRVGRQVETEHCRTAGLPEPDGGTAPLSDERQQALEEITPGCARTRTSIGSGSSVSSGTTSKREARCRARLAWLARTAKAWARGPPQRVSFAELTSAQQ